MFDFLVRTGPYGDHLGENPEGLTLERLKTMPHGVDFGPMQSRMAEVIYLPDGKIDFAPELITSDIQRFEAWLKLGKQTGLRLLGRRQVRSYSWLHSYPSLAKGPELCTLMMNPSDAATRGISDGQNVKVRSRTGQVTVPVELSDEMRPGVVSLPHGWGHDEEGIPGRQRARERPGVNYNLLADEQLMDMPSRNTSLNNVPVEVEPAN